MKIEILMTNLVNIFVIAVILELAIASIFTMDILKNMNAGRAILASRDLILVVLAVFLFYKVGSLMIFNKTGIILPKVLHILISALVLARISVFVRQFMGRMKQ